MQFYFGLIGKGQKIGCTQKATQQAKYISTKLDLLSNAEDYDESERTKGSGLKYLTWTVNSISGWKVKCLM